MFTSDMDASVDDLEQGLLAREAVISQLRQQQAEMLAALDAMQVHQMDGARSLQEWARARLDVSAATSRDIVDLARGLTDQPQLVEVAGAEESVSFERLVATSRLIASGADKETVDHSFRYDLAGVNRLRHRRRRIDRNTEKAVFVDRHLWTQHTLDGARGRFGGELPGFEFRIFTNALYERADLFADLPGPRTTKPQRLADALVSIAQDSRELPTPNGDPSNRSDPLVAVLVDGNLAEAGAEIEYGSRVGPGTLERVLCGGRIQLIGLAEGRPVTASHGTRAIPPAIRRLVALRDGGCTIDGCHSRYRLQPHHIRHRAYGGDNDPDNLATLCWYHHHVTIHGLGFRLDPDSAPQRRRFLRNHSTGVDPP
jgi:hypothetical protein